MSPTLALIALLAACPAFDAQVPVTVLEPSAYTQVAPPGSAGFATWWAGGNCRITLRTPVSARVACHEYRHCTGGYWHK